VTDPNGVEQHFRYHPLGMLTVAYRVGPDGRGGNDDHPEVRHEYHLAATPIAVRTSRRVHYASDGVSDETLESWEYLDGFGRVVQQRAPAAELAFGDAGLPSIGERLPDRVVVSGRQRYDAKGRVIERYEPFLSTGTAYEDGPPAGRSVRMSYDPVGRLVRLLNPDGSQRRTVFGEPADLTDPDEYAPTPWATTGYDENDLAPLSIDGTGCRSAAASRPSST
jgi:YD repeat-containing protein